MQDEKGKGYTDACAAYAMLTKACTFNKKFSYGRDSARCGNSHSRSLNVIHCCANQRGIYDCL